MKTSLLRLLVLVGLCFPLLGIRPAQAEQLPSQSDPAAVAASLGGCPLFPENNIWNTPVDDLPLHARSNQWINSIGRNTGFHMDFGSGTWAGGPMGIPYNVVGASVPEVSVSFYYPDESDPGPYPIPANPKIEHGSDHHILIVDSSTCTLYEIFDASYSGGNWYGGSGAIWDLNSNALRPDTWTSADAAGLPILPGLVRYEEVLSGEIDHAIRFTASSTNGYIWPARHFTSNDPDTPYIPPMGARFRLKASFDVAGYPPAMQVILNAMKKYGIILADNGSDWYVSGAPDSRWNNDMLHLLDDLTGDDFEAVDTSVLMVDYNSGATGFTISGNTGVGGVKLSYTDGKPKTVVSQGDGSYSILIPSGWSGTITPSKNGYIFLPNKRSYNNVTADKTAQDYTATPLYSISGNVGVSGATLNYLDGTPKTRPSGVNGNYSLTVPGGWDGTVTPTHTCFTFDPVDRSYTDLTGDQTGQDYSPTIQPGCADINTLIGGVNRGRFGLPTGASTRVSFAAVDKGPVKIESTNLVPLMGAERVIYKVNNLPTSFSEMMALPAGQLDKVYWLPWYNNKDLDTQLRFANVSDTDATVHVSIGGAPVTGSPFTLAPGASIRRSFPGLDKGPVKIESNVDIVAAERVIYNVNGAGTSFSEMMALPEKQLDRIYWLPWYNNKDLDTQLRFANVSDTEASVSVTIGGLPVDGSPFTLPAGASMRRSFPGIDKGPVRIESNVNIVAAERVIYKVNNVPVSFSEMMAMPNSLLDTAYWLPWYNSKELDTQLRFANVTDSTAHVTITIGGAPVVGSPFTLGPGASLRRNFPGLDKGPVKIESDMDIVASERVIYKVNNLPTSFSEMMALPAGLLDTIYWLPWYNSKDLDTQLRFGVP